MKLRTVERIVLTTVPYFRILSETLMRWYSAIALEEQGSPRYEYKNRVFTSRCDAEVNLISRKTWNLEFVHKVGS